MRSTSTSMGTWTRHTCIAVELPISILKYKPFQKHWSHQSPNNKPKKHGPYEHFHPRWKLTPRHDFCHFWLNINQPHRLQCQRISVISTEWLGGFASALCSLTECVNECQYVCVCVCACVRACVHASMHACVYSCVYMHVYKVYAYIHMYVVIYNADKCTCIHTPFHFFPKMAPVLNIYHIIWRRPPTFLDVGIWVHTGISCLVQFFKVTPNLPVSSWSCYKFTCLFLILPQVCCFVSNC